MNFRQWQHVRWSGAQHKCTADEMAIKKVDTSSEKPVAAGSAKKNGK